MTTRKTFLGRVGSTLGLLVFGAPRALYAALGRPTLTEALADGKWHNLLCYRVLDDAEKAFGFPPMQWTGAYADEVLSDGPPIPEWSF